MFQVVSDVVGPHWLEQTESLVYFNLIPTVSYFLVQSSPYLLQNICTVVAGPADAAEFKKKNFLKPDLSTFREI